MMDTLQDLKYGLRMMARNPGFAAVAVLTMALGIGANTAIFSLVNAVLFSPLPYRDPSRLVLVKELLPKIGPQPVTVSAPDILEIQKWNRSFDSIAGFRVWTYDLAGQGEPERIAGNRVSHNLFPLLGVEPAIGRSFTPDEDAPGRRVAILSYGLWQRRFAGDPEVIGRTATLDRRPFTVVGVMPKSFVFPLPGMSQGSPADLWVPLALTKVELSNIADNFDFGVMARLKPGTNLTQANADLALVARRILEIWSQAPGGSDIQLNVVAQSLGEQVTGPVKPMLLMLFGAVGFVLLIACANVANLLLARAAGRQREIAVRLAMGAGRGRLLRQLLAEGLLLAFAGGIFGLLFAFWLKETLVAGMPGNIPRFHPIALDLRVLFFTLAVAGGAGLLFGIFPALAAWRTNLNDTLKEGGRSASTGPRHQRLRAGLVIGEVALSTMLLLGAGLLLRSFQRVLATHPGFQPEHVLTASLALPAAPYSRPENYTAFYRQLLDRLRQMPGVKASGASSDLPLEGGWTHLFTPEGYQPPPGAPLNVGWHSVIFGDYMQAMGIPLLRGRYFTDQDQPNSPHVLIVSESLARRYWPNEDAIGKRLKWGPPSSTNPWLTVVGVVGDVKQGPLDAATAPHTYEPFVQLGGMTWLRVALRAEGDPASLAANLRAAVWSLDPQLSVSRVRTMDQVIGRTTAARRFNLFLLGSFAALALLLAAIGIYGVLAYTVTQRTHEIGVRMALGAQRGDVIRLVLGHGARMTAMGIVWGAAGGLGITRLLQDALYEVRPTDPATFAGVLLVLSLVALAAGYIPAWRATRVDPTQSLRYE